MYSNVHILISNTLTHRHQLKLLHARAHTHTHTHTCPRDHCTAVQKDLF